LDIKEELDLLEDILEKNESLIEFKIQNGIQYFICGYEIRDIENRISELKKLLSI